MTSHKPDHPARTWHRYAIMFGGWLIIYGYILIITGLAFTVSWAFTLGLPLVYPMARSMIHGEDRAFTRRPPKVLADLRISWHGTDRPPFNIPEAAPAMGWSKDGWKPAVPVTGGGRPGNPRPFNPLQVVQADALRIIGDQNRDLERRTVELLQLRESVDSQRRVIVRMQTTIDDQTRIIDRYQRELSRLESAIDRWSDEIPCPAREPLTREAIAAMPASYDLEGNPIPRKDPFNEEA